MTTTRGLAFPIAACLLFGCGDSDEPPLDAPQSSDAQFVIDAAFGDAAFVDASPIDASLIDAPSTDAPSTDASLIDASMGADAGLLDQSGVTSALPIVIWAVDFDQDAVWLKNISGGTVDMAEGDVCIPFTYLPVGASNFGSVLGTFSFAPGEIKKVCLDDASVPVDCDAELTGTSAVWDLDEDAEFVVYINDNHAVSSMQDYVRWGDTAGTLRESQAVGVSLWVTGQTVPITAGHRGLVAVGDVTTAAGYVSVQSPASCCGL